MNLHPQDYALLEAIALSGGCTRAEIQSSLKMNNAKSGFDRLRKAGLIEVVIEATHKNFEGEGSKRRAVMMRRGQAIAHRWAVTEIGRLLSGTLGQ